MAVISGHRARGALELRNAAHNLELPNDYAHSSSPTATAVAVKAPPSNKAVAVASARFASLPSSRSAGSVPPKIITLKLTANDADGAEELSPESSDDELDPKNVLARQSFLARKILNKRNPNIPTD